MEEPNIVDVHTRCGNAIRERRRLLCIDQAALAELSGVSRHTVSNVEGGEGNPTLTVLAALCDALGLEVVLRPRVPEEFR
ncbi:MAG: helix-turn-helix transcriptional regulator [Deltaproteobacteria bacterium]|nr:helix-turn-helix transcriptional regulator [Deltaproteobacteria bacterium]